MKPKTVIPLILGVCVGGVAIKLVVDVVSNAQGASQANMTQCVVANMDIGFAEEITLDMLTLKEWPKDSLPPEYFDTLENLANRVTNMYIPKDVPVYPSMLAQEGTPPGIQTRIKPGYRAVSIGIDEVTGVAYQLQPGDRVDVISLVQRRRYEGGSEFVSRVILQNVEIIAVGRTLYSGKPGDAPKSVARSVTLLLTPVDVPKLHLATSNRGRIQLALRGNSDSSPAEQIASATNDQLLGLEPMLPKHPEQDDAKDSEPVAQPVRSPFAAPPSWTVTVIKGNEIRSVEYRKIDGRWVASGASQHEGAGPAPMPVQPSPGPSGGNENG